jgi:hypothetical protein
MATLNKLYIFSSPNTYQKALPYPFVFCPLFVSFCSGVCVMWHQMGMLSPQACRGALLSHGHRSCDVLSYKDGKCFLHSSSAQVLATGRSESSPPLVLEMQYIGIAADTSAADTEARPVACPRIGAFALLISTCTSAAL